MTFVPPRASTMASHVDAVTGTVLGIAVFFAVLIAVLIVIFSLRYHASREVNRTEPQRSTLPIEIAWTVIPTAIAMGIFFYASHVYLRMTSAPADAEDIYVVGKQWMWKIQHMNGRREINTLHVPVGKPIRLLMTSEDVIHSFYIPAFRTKQDVLPGRYTSEWFQATRAGEYALFCAEFCGTQHSGMIGRVIVQEPAAYRAWAEQGDAAKETLAGRGQRLFATLRCASCHAMEAVGTAPSLNGLYGRPVALADGRTVVADETYLRESILNPNAQVAQGYAATMPTYQNQVDEEGIAALIAYIKSTGTDRP